METGRFVGRDAILAEIAAAVADTRRGHGSLLVLNGPAGAGKTWAAEEAVRRTEDCRVLWAWCPPGETAGAYRPWAQILRELVAGAARAAGSADSPSVRALIAGRVIEAVPAGGEHPDPAGVSPEAARHVLTGDVAELLRRAAAERPLLIVLDDVHDADSSSLRLLLDLVPTLRANAIAVVATARDDPASWPGRLDQRAALFRQARRLPLGPLTSDDVSVLVSAATGAPADPDEVRALVERTGGDAFFVAELLHHRDLADRAGRPAQAARAGAEPQVPESVRSAVQARTAQLPPRAASLLAVAAALGTRFRLDVLAEVGGVPFGEVSAVLSDAKDTGLLVSAEPGWGRFRHDLMREAVHDALPAPDRLELHERIAAVLAELARRGRDVEPAEVAGHLLAAGDEGGAAEYAGEAGDRAAAMLAFDDAVRWYERCESASHVAGWPARRRGELAVALGTARLGTGDRPGAREDFLRAATLAREADDPALLARAALGPGSGAPGFEVDLLDRVQTDLLEEARARLDPRQKSLLAAVTARLSVATTLMESETRRLGLAEEAVDLARESGDLAALAYALSALCDARSGPADCERRRQWAEEIVAHARRLHDVPLELLGRRLRLVALLEIGAPTEAEQEAFAFDAAARVLGQPLYEWYVPLWRGMRALTAGRFDACRDALAEAEAIGRKAGSGNAEMLVGTLHWSLLAELGDRDGIAALAEEFPPPDEIGGVWPYVSYALLAAQLGRLDEARDRLASVAPRLADAPHDSEWLPMLGQAAEAIGMAGTPALARDVYALLEPFADLFVVEGIGAYLRGPVQRYLGLLAAVSGDREAAARHYAAALQRTESLGATGLAARIAREAVEHAARPSEAPSPVVSTEPNVIHHEGEWWVLRYAGRQVHLRDSKGLHDLAALVTRPGVPVPALDLATGTSPERGADPGEHLHAPGDLGETVDAQARDAYRRRLEELTAEAEEADADGDEIRSARIAVERDALVEQLSAAYGLGGRARRSGSPAERARTTVTARLRAAIDRISEVHPELGRHLRSAVRTGTLCVYEPESPQAWQA